MVRPAISYLLDQLAGAREEWRQEAEKLDHSGNPQLVRGWSAECPACTTATAERIFVTSDAILLPCKAGHGSGEVLAALDAFKEAVTQAVAEPPGIAVADLLARVIPRVQWLVLGYVQEGTSCVLAGPPGAGKTLLAFDWCAQLVAAGRKVFLAQNEGGEQPLQERLSRASTAAGFDASRPVPKTFRYERNISLNLSHFLDVRAFGERLKGYDLIVLDSLASFWPGLNENDPEHMSLVAEALKILVETSGAAVVGIHHTTKAAWKDGEVPSLADIRGHGTLGGRIDAAFICKPLERVEGLVRFDLYVVKQRDEDHRPPKEIEILMSGPAATLTMSDKQGKVGAGRKPKMSFEEVKRAVIAYVRASKPLPSGNRVAHDLGGSKSIVLDAIDELIEAKKLARIGTAKTSRLAVLNTGSESEEL